MLPSNAAVSARPLAGSAQQDTKLYTPTDGGSVGFVIVIDVVDAVVLVVEVEDEDVVEEATEVVVVAEEFDDISW